MRDFGGMISFLAESEEEAVELVARTKLFKLAESLGGVESLIEHPARMTHASTADAPFAAPTNLIRLSVGIESADDLIADLEAALVRSRRRHAPERRIACPTDPDRPPPPGAERVIGLVPRSRRRTARRSSTAARPLASTRSRPGLARARARARATSGTCCSRTSISTTPAPRACSSASTRSSRSTSPRSARRTSSTRRGSRSARDASTATRSTRCGASSRPCPRRTCTSSATASLGLDCFPTPGHASHHVCYLDGDGTLYAGDAAGVRIQPDRACSRRRRRPSSTSTRGSATLDEIERRAPERLALIHFGVADDVARAPRASCAAAARVGRAVARRPDAGRVRRAAREPTSATPATRTSTRTSGRCRSGSRTPG